MRKRLQEARLPLRKVGSIDIRNVGVARDRPPALPLGSESPEGSQVLNTGRSWIWSVSEPGLDLRTEVRTLPSLGLAAPRTGLVLNECQLHDVKSRPKQSKRLS